LGCLPFWGNVEYLLWWEKGTRLPALVTTSPANTDRDDAGVLGQSATQVLFGDERVEDGSRSGGRLMIGRWLNPHQTAGIMGRYFGIEDRVASFQGDSDQLPILARPFFNAFTDESDALLVGFPGELEGNLGITADSEIVGADVAIRKIAYCGCNYRFDWIVGYRYTSIDESLRIANSLEFVDPQGRVPLGTVVDQLDAFNTDNDFHGADLGLIGHSRDGNWTLDLLAKVALGNMRQRIAVNGSTLTTTPQQPDVTSVGGLLTQESNIGLFENDEFAVVTEIGVTLGYQVTCRANLSVGYSLIHWNHVAQPGDQIDSNVNLTQQTGDLIGPARPAVLVGDSDYWLQGINFGLNWSY
jgi:hypothetical protein